MKRLTGDWGRGTLLYYRACFSYDLNYIVIPLFFIYNYKNMGTQIFQSNLARTGSVCFP